MFTALQSGFTTHAVMFRKRFQGALLYAMLRSQRLPRMRFRLDNKPPCCTSLGHAPPPRAPPLGDQSHSEQTTTRTCVCRRPSKVLQQGSWLAEYYVGAKKTFYSVEFSPAFTGVLFGDAVVHIFEYFEVSVHGVQH